MSQRRRNDNINKICVLEGFLVGGEEAEGKLCKNTVFLGKVHDNKIWKICEFYCQKFCRLLIWAARIFAENRWFWQETADIQRMAWGVEKEGRKNSRAQDMAPTIFLASPSVHKFTHRALGPF